MSQIPPRLNGSAIRSMMRSRGLTIRALASAMNITQERVRQVRKDGVRGHAFVIDWLEALGF